MIFRVPACRASLAVKPSYSRLSRRWLTSPAALEHLTSPVQSYISTSDDPYLNLSIEHHLLQTTPPDSAVLFLYTNRPSIIIGRNQNPWLEVNLALLNATANKEEENNALPSLSETGLTGTVDLVRRRSGGGTVFHDQGNVNWTVISPSSAFTRDKHAEMVVRALRSAGIARARVNERHDVVLDQGQQGSGISDADDTHATPFQTDAPRPLKVSGSAYKLTRARALHHGTCLLNSPHLHVIPHYLHSPAKGFVTARGVESVSSPVGNILLENERFEAGVREHFARMYGEPSSGDAVQVGGEWREVEGVRKGIEELKSREWTYLQTPQFTFNSRGNPSTPTDSTSSTTSNKSTPNNVPTTDAIIEFTARYGVITEANVRLTPSSPSIGDGLVGKRLHEITDWRDALTRPIGGAEEQSRFAAAAEFMRRVLPSVGS